MKKPLLSEMTLREKIGQTALGRPANKGYLDLEKYPYGCIWGLGNVEMGVMNMADEMGEIVTNRGSWLKSLELMNKKSKIPLLQATDCTVGIKNNFSEMEMLLDPVTMGAANSEDVAYEAGRLRAKMLRCVGSRWVWSQEVDLPNRSCAVMLGRQYSDNPEKLLRMNIADMKGCQAEGVAACAKHFPGTDGIEYRDAHTCQNVMLLPVDEWKEYQGKMFQGMFDAGVDSVMISHTAFPFCDNTQRNGHYVPSTLSYKVITELLKGEMGFKGVVITDGIEMRSVAAYCEDDWNRVYVEAIKAGNDVVLGVRDNYFDAIENAVLSGEIPESRIDDACQRVLDLKEKYGFFDEDFTISKGTPEEINALASDFRERVTKKSVSLVCDKHKLLPLDKNKIKRVSIIYSGHDKTGAGKAFDNLSIMKQEFEKRGATVDIRRGLENRLDSTSELKEISDNSDLIIYAGFLMRYLPEGFNSFFNEELTVFHYALSHGVEKSIGIGLGSPFMYFDFYYSFPAFINAYNYCDETMKSIVAAMYGEIGFEGVEPFELIPKNFRHYLDILDERK